jgi:hypothetical protein
LFSAKITFIVDLYSDIDDGICGLFLVEHLRQSFTRNICLLTCGAGSCDSFWQKSLELFLAHQQSGDRLDLK